MSSVEPEVAEVRERTGCVVGISLGLVLILALVGLLFNLRGAVLDPEEVLGEQFSHTTFPFELEFSGAAALPGGDRIVRLSHPDYRESESASESSFDSSSEEWGDDSGMGKDAGLWTPPTIDWIEGTGPSEVFFVFSKSAANSVALFSGKKSDDGMSGSGGRGRGRGRGSRASFGGGDMGSDHLIAMSGGDLDWGRSRVGYRYERRFEQESGYDEIRVNLSEPGRYCVLIARWPANHTGSPDKIEELLAALTPKQS